MYMMYADITENVCSIKVITNHALYFEWLYLMNHSSGLNTLSIMFTSQ